jgi:hypothetical protein
MKKSKTPEEAANIQPTAKTSLSQRLANLSRELAHFWSTKVEVKGSDRRGKIVIHYSSRQELDRILEGMQTEKAKV